MKGIDSMDEQYKKLIIETLESYPKYRHKFIYQEICKHLHFGEDGNSLFQYSDDFIKICKSDSDLQKIKCAIEQKKQGIVEVLKTEFYHSYKYATLLEVKQGEEENIKAFISSKEKFIDSNYHIDNLTNDIDVDYIPSYLEVEQGVRALKFAMELTGYLPIPDNNETVHKYNVVLLYFEEENIIEIRWDSIKTHYKSMYPDLYDKVKHKTMDWVKSNIRIDCIPVNLSRTVEAIKQSDNHDIIVAAQEMRLKTGAFMTLDIGLNEDAILPFLGELKEMMLVEGATFEANEETKMIKKMIEDLIKDKEETSDLPWITLIWGYNKKTKARAKAIEIKFSFNHNDDIFDIMMYYGNKPEAGRMNDVTRFLIKNKRRILSSGIS